ncbi:hypothetical protein ERN12_07660 [Rhodobacteraceae bacterium]|nr:hypothetical protein ERN12_07660 [Paracoccaceae bacterium]
MRSVDAALGVPAPSGQVASRACLDRMFKDNMAHHTMIARDHAMQSGYEQQWALAGMSLAAFKLEQADQPLSPQALEWLRALARAVMDFHDHHSLQNNHLLWTALGVGTTGYLTGDQELIDWANESTRQSLSTMNPDGTLALELLRGPKASAYHYFAAQPVFVYSAVRRCFHDPPRAPWPDQLERLSAVLDRIEDDPQFLAQRAGVPQRAITPEQSQWRALFAPAGDRTPLPRIDASVGRRGGQLSTTARALDCH